MDFAKTFTRARLGHFVFIPKVDANAYLHKNHKIFL